MRFLARFLATEAASGIVLMAAAALALLLANSPFAALYAAAFSAHATTLVINDGLMALFFLLIGMEIKREFAEGALSTRARAMLPAIGAAGGVITPALIYWWFNGQDAYAMRGFAIPTATDIAFSLGVLALFGKRVPASLKVFLMAVAVIDDLIAVAIIAVFYTDSLSLLMLALSFGLAIQLFMMNRRGIDNPASYLVIGALLWWCVLKSGVHPTIAGVALGLLMPAAAAERIEPRLHPWVAFGIMPLFALANAGVPLFGLRFADLMQPLPLGIALGLFAGKQLGIFGACWMAIRCRLAEKPKGASWPQIYAVCIIAGIGFTMSLFIGDLAFVNPDVKNWMRLGVLSGSLCSAIIGSIVLASRLPRR